MTNMHRVFALSCTLFSICVFASPAYSQLNSPPDVASSKGAWVLIDKPNPADNSSVSCGLIENQRVFQEIDVQPSSRARAYGCVVRANKQIQLYSQVTHNDAQSEFKVVNFGTKDKPVSLDQGHRFVIAIDLKTEPELTNKESIFGFFAIDSDVPFFQHTFSASGN